ncbi:MAG TPA: peptidoglycan DD-metalloendopeptidase family protein [Dinghuibacter sp.]|uniref:peptidoglycan DD-metalloendopeptidase family protein n=1 Tax=Dinghuibacter sp. TaxID=2024697 RepID=UPI002B7A7B35|nr:peptidoglycan DD-metalloendopeptidase family protein [Dinghuibacter sp.]HTJ14888.1 peptidoglycan DD-metalloendopeptidase family protein [Dinghuibacter sp.]
MPLDLSTASGLSPEVFGDLDKFSAFIDDRLRGNRYLVGGYAELRAIYASSALFDGSEPRRLHLGVDIWGAVETPVFAPFPGRVHSLAFNEARGDYGATLILVHEGPVAVWHTLYGHLGLSSLAGRTPGDIVAAGDRIASFGAPPENGWWPPHLHFQVILDMEGLVGDYPGVCRASEREYYLENCPDPMPLLGFMRL